MQSNKWIYFKAYGQIHCQRWIYSLLMVSKLIVSESGFLSVSTAIALANAC